MAYDHNTQNRKEKSQNVLVRLEEMKLNTNDLKGKLKGIVIKELKEDNKRLRRKCSKLENMSKSLKNILMVWSNTIDLNNVAFSSIPDSVRDSQLESILISVFADIDVSVSHSDVEDCQWSRQAG